VLLGAALSAAVASARPASAADDAVRIACPDLTTERAAELESRIRANLLTAELPATVLLSCRTERAEVRVDAAPESVTVHVPIGSIDTLRDDVLRGVEEALQELLRRRARLHDPTNTTEANAAPTALEPGPGTAGPTPPPQRPVATPAPQAQPVTKPPPPPARAWTELFGAALGEAWRDRIAVGGALGVARSTPTIWFGLRAAVLRPAAGSADFSATEGQISAEVGVQPSLLAGVRASLGLGPSVLFIKPHADLTTRNNPVTTSLFFAAHVSRPFWFGRFGLLPEVGARLFTGARGVHIDGDERLRLSGIVPALSLSLVYRLE
jgi:hypothetical protein